MLYVEVSHYVLFNVGVELDSMEFSGTEFMLAVENLSGCHWHGTFRSKEIVSLIKY